MFGATHRGWGETPLATLTHGRGDGTRGAIPELVGDYQELVVNKRPYRLTLCFITYLAITHIKPFPALVGKIFMCDSEGMGRREPIRWPYNPQVRDT